MSRISQSEIIITRTEASREQCGGSSAEDQRKKSTKRPYPYMQGKGFKKVKVPQHPYEISKQLPRAKNTVFKTYVAEYDKGYFVEKVLSGGRCVQNSGRYFFLLQWRDFNENTWVSWETNKDCAHIDQYMQKNKARYVNTEAFVEYTVECGNWPNPRGSMDHTSKDTSTGRYFELIIPGECMISAINIIFDQRIYSCLNDLLTMSEKLKCWQRNGKVYDSYFTTSQFVLINNVKYKRERLWSTQWLNSSKEGLFKKLCECEAKYPQTWLLMDSARRIEKSNVLHCWVVRKNKEKIESVDDNGNITSIMQLPDADDQVSFEKWDPKAATNNLYLYKKQFFPIKKH